MIAKTYTCSLLGIDAILVEVEVDLASGLPGVRHWVQANTLMF